MSDWGPCSCSFSHSPRGWPAFQGMGLTSRGALQVPADTQHRHNRISQCRRGSSLKTFPLRHWEKWSCHFSKSSPMVAKQHASALLHFPLLRCLPLSTLYPHSVCSWALPCLSVWKSENSPWAVSSSRATVVQGLVAMEVPPILPTDQAIRSAGKTTAGPFWIPNRAEGPPLRPSLPLPSSLSPFFHSFFLPSLLLSFPPSFS